MSVVSVGALLSVTPASLCQFTLVRVGDGYYATNQVNGLARAVAVAGDHAYLANNEDGLRIVNVSNPAEVREVWHFANPSGAYAYAVCISGQHAYLANGFDGLRIFDVADPGNAMNIGHEYPGGFAVGVTVRGKYAYLSSYDGGLNVLDVSNPTNPIPVAQTNNGGNACSIALSGPYAFLANLSDGLRVYDVSNPSVPINIGHTNINPSISTAGDPADLKVFGHFAYVAQEFLGLQIFDISTPSLPLWTNGICFGSSAISVDISDQGNYALVGCYPQALYLCDVSSPGNIQIVGSSYDPEFIYGVTFRSNYLYVADGLRGMRTYLAVPQLTIGLAATNRVIVSWPQPLADGFILQHNSDLSTTNWVGVTDVPAAVSNRCQIVLAPNTVHEFFRLRFVQ